MKLVENTCRDSFDLFYGLFKYNKHSAEQIQRLREGFANVERQLAAKEAYLAAKTEIMQDEKKKLFAECRTLIREAVAQSTLPPLPPPPSSQSSSSSAPAAEAATEGKDVTPRPTNPIIHPPPQSTKR